MCSATCSAHPALNVLTLVPSTPSGYRLGWWRVVWVCWSTACGGPFCHPTSSGSQIACTASLQTRQTLSSCTEVSIKAHDRVLFLRTSTARLGTVWPFSQCPLEVNRVVLRQRVLHGWKRLLRQDVFVWERDLGDALRLNLWHWSSVLCFQCREWTRNHF